MAYQSDNPFEPGTGPWVGRVDYSPRGFAFVPDQLLASGDEARQRAVQLILEQTGKEPRQTKIIEGEWLLESDTPFDVDFVVAELQHLDLRVEPNHVLFTHGGGCGCGAGCSCPCGACASGHVGAGHTANPFTATPSTATPFTATPFTATPFTATPFTATGARPSSARPADKPDAVSAPALDEDVLRVIIMDSGLAADDYLPDLLGKRPILDATPDSDRDKPDESGDGHLDPVSGHGTFIAGIIEQLAPKQRVQVADVVTTFGDTNAAAVSHRLFQLLADGDIDDTTIVNMSFGGYSDEKMSLLALAIRRVQATGAVVVASAGNDSSCRPTFPAVFPGVVSVGSIEPHGRAFYSNFGPWVRACAPGTDLTSTFYRNYDGDFDRVPNGPDPDKFDGWAQWTGTSFAAPVVVAALVRHAILHQTTLKKAVAAVIDSPSLARHHGLGTIVNLAPGL